MTFDLLPFLTRHRPTLVIVGGTALICGALFATGPSATPEATLEKAWPVTVVDVTPSLIRPSFRVFGRFEASQSAVLSSDLVASVAEVVVREGDQVKAGDALLRLNAGDIERKGQEMTARRDGARAGLASMQNELSLAERTREDYAALHAAALAKRERHRELLERKLISQVLFDEVQSQAAEASIRYQTQQRVLADLPNRLTQARAELAAAEASLAQVQADLEKSVIRAPFDGPIMTVAAAPGEMNVPGRALLEIASTSSFELRLEVPDRYIERLQAYLAAGVPVTARTEGEREFVLARLARQVRQGQGGIDAFFLPADAQARDSVIGVVLQASITMPAEADLVALPSESIYESDRIYRVEDGRLLATSVERVGETGDQGIHRILVRSAAFKGGASVLVTQLPQAVNGMLVTPIRPLPDNLVPDASASMVKEASASMVKDASASVRKDASASTGEDVSRSIESDA